MYAQHQPIISEFARRNADNFADVITFVYLTIHNPFQRVKAEMLDVRKRGSDSAALWGWKRGAYVYVQEHKVGIFEDCERIWNETPCSEVRETLVMYLAKLPGLGFAKAGFVAQLIYGVSACLDTHNMQRFNIGPNTFKARKAKAKNLKVRARHWREYHYIVDAEGGTEGLWDSWCHYVAEQWPTSYENGEHVSRLHCECLGLKG